MISQLPVYSSLSRYIVVYVFAILLSTTYCSPPNFAGSSVDSGGVIPPHSVRNGPPTRRIVKTLLHNGIRPTEDKDQQGAEKVCNEYGDMLPEINSREDFKKLRIDHAFSTLAIGKRFWLGHRYSIAVGWTNLSPSSTSNQFLNEPWFSERIKTNSTDNPCFGSPGDCCMVYSMLKPKVSDEERIELVKCKEAIMSLVVCAHHYEEDEEPVVPPIDVGPLQERVEALEKALKTPSNNGSFVQNQPISSGVIISICIATSFITYLIFFAVYLVYEKRGNKCSDIITSKYSRTSTAPPED